MGSTLVALNACSMFPDKDNSMFRDRDKDYLSAQPNAEMNIPEGVEAPQFEPLYPIPEIQALDEFGDPQSLENYEIPRPNTRSGDDESAAVTIQRLGEQRWIFLNASTSQVWPHVQSFLTEAQVDVWSSNAQAGLIETAWFQYNDDKSVMARFRISLEKGLHPDSTEIHITEYQQAMGGDPNAPQPWPETSSDSAREEWMVDKMATHLAGSVSNASASLLGQNIGGEVKAQFVSGAPEPTLRLNLNRARAWAAMINASKLDGFVPWDRSLEKGVIYAGYNEDQYKKRGFFRKYFSFGFDGRLPESVKHGVTDLLGRLENSADVRAKFDAIEGVAYGEPLNKVRAGYLIVMEYNAKAADIVIRDHRGRRLPADEAKKLLRIMRKNLI